MLTVEEARARVLSAVQPLDPVEVLVGDALGLVLADDAIAPHPLPRFDNSAMDGFAVRGVEAGHASAESPVALEVIGEVRAGSPGEIDVTAGTAVRIMTGAPLPAGADAVAPVEEARESDGVVTITGATPKGRHVRPAGDDFAKGSMLVRSGHELGPGELALLASTGFSPLRVRRGPRVAILVTGDELVAPEAAPEAGQIRDSNSVALKALASQAGAEVVAAITVGDDRASTLEAFRRAAELADLVISSGGVAVGRYDFVKEVVEELGQIGLWRVAMQPGKPVVLGSIGDTPFLGLPGNPVSIHIGFEQFVRPAIRRMRGCRNLLRPRTTATLTVPVEKAPGRLHFIRVRLSSAGRIWQATPTGPQGSHIQSSLVDCHGVARFEIDAVELEAGAEVTVEVWRLPPPAAEINGDE